MCITCHPGVPYTLAKLAICIYVLYIPTSCGDITSTTKRKACSVEYRYYAHGRKKCYVRFDRETLQVIHVQVIHVYLLAFIRECFFFSLKVEQGHCIVDTRPLEPVVRPWPYQP